MKKTYSLTKVILLTLSLAMIFVSCGKTVTADESTLVNTPSSTGANETADDLYKKDREIIDDYKNISPSGTHDVRVLFTNAGKADSIIIEADGKIILIDAGAASSVPRINAALEYVGAEKIDTVFLTHSHNDHIGGLSLLSEMWNIGECYTASVSQDMSKIKETVGKASLTSNELLPGAVYAVSEGLYLEVLGPIRYNPIDDNDNSLVLKMQVNGAVLLFAADMQYDEEKTLMHAGFDLNCDLLKVGNHGNKDATSVSFMEETSPDYAVITTDREVDENSAHKSVVNGLHDRGADVFVTDEYPLGVIAEVAEDGKIIVSEAVPHNRVEGISLVSVSKNDQTVVIRNDGKSDADISHWFIVSSRGGEVFMFPDGAVIKAGDEITVSCTEYRGDSNYLWSDSRVWHKSKDDTANLIDRWGNLVSEKESE